MKLIVNFIWVRIPILTKIANANYSKTLELGRPYYSRLGFHFLSNKAFE